MGAETSSEETGKQYSISGELLRLKAAKARGELSDEAFENEVKTLFQNQAKNQVGEEYIKSLETVEPKVAPISTAPMTNITKPPDNAHTNGGVAAKEGEPAAQGAHTAETSSAKPDCAAVSPQADALPVQPSVRDTDGVTAAANIAQPKPASLTPTDANSANAAPAASITPNENAITPESVQITPPIAAAVSAMSDGVEAAHTAHPQQSDTTSTEASFTLGMQRDGTPIDLGAGGLVIKTTRLKAILAAGGITEEQYQAEFKRLLREIAEANAQAAAVAAAASAEELRPRFACSGGHTLEPARVNSDMWQCNLCGTALPVGALVLSCRPCDFDGCGLCLARISAENPDQALPPPSLPRPGAPAASVAVAAESGGASADAASAESVGAGDGGDKNGCVAGNGESSDGVKAPTEEAVAPESAEAGRKGASAGAGSSTVMRCCMAGHGLYEFCAPDSAWACDVCGMQLRQGAFIYGCRRCNWDTCQRCYDVGHGTTTFARPSAAAAGATVTDSSAAGAQAAAVGPAVGGAGRESGEGAAAAAAAAAGGGRVDVGGGSLVQQVMRLKQIRTAGGLTEEQYNVELKYLIAARAAGGAGTANGPAATVSTPPVTTPPAAAALPGRPAPLPPRFGCPGGHVLTQFATSDDRWLCNVCKGRLAQGSVMFGCRTCDWDGCLVCRNALLASEAAADGTQADSVQPAAGTSTVDAAALSALAASSTPAEPTPAATAASSTAGTSDTAVAASAPASSPPPTAAAAAPAAASVSTAVPPPPAEQPVGTAGGATNGPSVSPPSAAQAPAAANGVTAPTAVNGSVPAAPAPAPAPAPAAPTAAAQEAAPALAGPPAMPPPAASAAPGTPGGGVLSGDDDDDDDDDEGRHGFGDVGEGLLVGGGSAVSPPSGGGGRKGKKKGKGGRR